MVPKYYNKKPSKSKGSGRKGKANKTTPPPPVVANVGEDRSLLSQSIETGVRGVRELVKALAGGSPQFQNLLINECSVIYECKVCMNLFRSLANFISHKRFYCLKSYTQFPDVLNSLQSESLTQPPTDENVHVVEPDTPPQNEQNLNDPDVWVTSDQACNSESVIIVDGPRTLTPRKKWDFVKPSKRQDITEALARFKEKRENGIVKTSDKVPDSKFYSDMASKMLRDTPDPVIELEDMKDTRASVFQTLKLPNHGDPVDSMKVQLIDIDRVFATNQAVLQENGKFVVTSEEMETEEEKNLEKHYCPHCEKSFLTKKTLTGHIEIYHKERICYPCPLCKLFFASPTGVYRHLSKGITCHHRTEYQIRRLRPQVLNKARKRLLLSKDSDTSDECKRSMREAEEEWMNSFEGALRCNGCGKRFNRRAVLNVHTMTCRKMEALLRASESTNKAKSTHTSKNSHKSPGKNSRSSRLSGSGILVRKDYRKTGYARGKPHNSSLLTEVETPMEAHGSSSWNEGSLDEIRKAGPSIFNTKSYFEKMSTSSDNSSVACSSSSQRSPPKKKRNSPDAAKSKKGNEKTKKKNF